MERPQPVVLCAGAPTCPQFETCEALFNVQATAYETAVASVDVRINSVFFNAFIWLQLGNLINSRKISDEWNIFEGIAASGVFIGIYALIAAMQVFIMEVPFMNTVFQIVPITPLQWGISLAIGFSCIFVGYALRIVSRIVHVGADRAEKERASKAAEAAAKRV
jgi:magnesium-transporting ATPase (P-type)